MDHRSPPSGTELAPGETSVTYFFGASEVAEAFSRSVGADDEAAKEHLNVALMVGQHLADEGAPGRWDCIHIRRFLAQLPDEDHSWTVFHLSWMLSYLAKEEALSFAQVYIYLDALAV